MLHDLWHLFISKMTLQAQKLVIDRLTTHEFSSKYRAEVLRIVQFIKNGEGSDGREFLQKMQTTDEYRKQSFLDSHNEIAEAMGYGKA
jgi:FlaA1/EpsC-like NDP-sugar epimerase